MKFSSPENEIQSAARVVVVSPSFRASSACSVRAACYVIPHWRRSIAGAVYATSGLSNRPRKPPCLHLCEQPERHPNRHHAKITITLRLWNMTLIRRLLEKTALGGTRLIRWLQEERLLASKKRCPLCNSRMQFKKPNTTKEGYRW